MNARRGRVVDACAVNKRDEAACFEIDCSCRHPTGRRCDRWHDLGAVHRAEHDLDIARRDLAADFPTGIGHCMQIDVQPATQVVGEAGVVKLRTDHRPMPGIGHVLLEGDHHSTVLSRITEVDMCGRVSVGATGVQVQRYGARFTVDSGRCDSARSARYYGHFLAAAQTREQHLDRRRCDLAADFAAGIGGRVNVDVVASGAKRSELTGIERCIDGRPALDLSRVPGEVDRDSTVCTGVTIMQMGNCRIVDTACVGMRNQCGGNRIDSDRKRAARGSIDDRHPLAALKAAKGENNIIRDDLATDLATRIRRTVDIDVGRSGEQRSELRAAERLLFGEPVGWIAAILKESDLDRAVDTSERKVQVGAGGIVQASGIGVQRQ